MFNRLDSPRPPSTRLPSSTASKSGAVRGRDSTPTSTALCAPPGVSMRLTVPSRACPRRGPQESSRKPSIAARGLVKRFGDVRAVDGIDLEVPRGMIFAILGPNGAGKTTLMRMLATLAAPDAGSADGAWATISSPRRTRCARVDRHDRPVRLARRGSDRPRESPAARPPLGLSRARGESPRRRAAGRLRSVRRGRRSR